MRRLRPAQQPLEQLCRRLSQRGPVDKVRNFSAISHALAAAGQQQPLEQLCLRIVQPESPVQEANR